MKIAQAHRLSVNVQSCLLAQLEKRLPGAVSKLKKKEKGLENFS